MKKLTLLLIVFVLIVGGCINKLDFKECDLEYKKIKENQITKLWIEIENKGETQKDVQVVFEYPETVVIEKRGKKVYGFNSTLEPEGSTTGRKSFNVYGEYIEGQPSSPWDINVKIYSENELVTEKRVTVTILPP